MSPQGWFLLRPVRENLLQASLLASGDSLQFLDLSLLQSLALSSRWHSPCESLSTCKDLSHLWIDMDSSMTIYDMLS